MKTKAHALRLFMAAILTLALCGPAAADPAPFGLAIGKMTVDEFKKKYAIRAVGIDKNTQRPKYIVDTAKSGIHFDGLRELAAIFGEDGKLIAVFAEIHKYRFDSVYESLRNKYLLLSRRIPVPFSAYQQYTYGDFLARAKFKDADTFIYLSAPLMSFTMTIKYKHMKYLRLSYEVDSKKREEKRKQVEPQL